MSLSLDVNISDLLKQLNLNNGSQNTQNIKQSFQANTAEQFLKDMLEDSQASSRKFMQMMEAPKQSVDETSQHGRMRSQTMKLAKRLVDASDSLFSDNICAPTTIPDEYKLDPIDYTTNDMATMSMTATPYVFPNFPAMTIENTIVFNGEGSLQEFINSVKPNTRVQIPAKVYNEHIKINKDIVIQSIGGKCKIEGFLIENGICVFEEIEIQQQPQRNGGVMVLEGYAQFKNCTMHTLNCATVTVENNGSVELINCRITSSKNPCVYACTNAAVHIADCFLEDSEFLGLLAVNHSQVQIERSTLRNNKEGGILISGTVNFHMDRCTLDRNGLKGIEVMSSGVIFIVRSNFMNSYSGPSIFLAGRVSVNIIKCEFSNCMANAIQARNSASVISKQNKYVNSGTSISVVTTMTASFTSHGDVFEGDCQVAVATLAGGQAFIDDITVNITSGTALYSSGDGSLMCLERGVVNNTPDISVQCGYGGRMDLINLTVANSKDAGFVLTKGARGSFDNVVVTRCSGTACEVSDSSDLKISNCKFTDNEKAAVVVRGNSSPEFIGCTMANSGHVGVEVTGDGANPAFRDCMVENNMECGYNLNQGTKAVISGGSCRFNKKGGFICDGASPDVSRCIITDNGSAGISAFCQAQPSFTRCRSQNNDMASCQAQMEGTIVKMTECEFGGDKKSGTLVAINQGAIVCTKCVLMNSKMPHAESRNGGAVAFTGCEISRSKSGIALQTHSGGFMHVIQSVIYNESKIGILVGRKGHLDLISSRITNVGDTAVILNDEANAVIQSSIIENSENGLQVNAASLHITNTTFSACKGIAVSRVPESNIIDQGVQFMNNGKDVAHVNA